MAKKYNTVKTTTIAAADEEREFLRALSGCVCLTPEEEERICPSINTGYVEHEDSDLDEDFPDLDALDPSDDEISDAQLIRDLLRSE